MSASDLNLTRAAQDGHVGEAVKLSERLEPLWALFRQHGSLRVVAAATEILGWIDNLLKSKNKNLLI